MKKSLIVFSLFSLFLSQGILADDNCIVVGYHEPNTQTYDGPTFCKSVSIKNIIVYGPLTTNQTKLLGKITIRGTMTVDQSHIRGNTTISGPIFSTDSTFQKITVENNYSQGYVTLKNTIIKGPLVFKGQSGIVCKDNNSMLLGGIVNGEVDQNCSAK